MATVIDELGAKVDWLERELAEVRQELDQLRSINPLTPEE